MDLTSAYYNEFDSAADEDPEPFRFAGLVDQGRDGADRLTRAALERCLAEQRAAAAYLLEHPGERGAALWLADWVAEELEILMGEEQTEA